MDGEKGIQNSPKPVSSEVKIPTSNLLIILIILLIIITGGALAFAGYMYGRMQAMNNTGDNNPVTADRSIPSAKPSISARLSPTTVPTSGSNIPTETATYTDQTHPGRALNPGWQRYVNQRFFYSIEFPPEVEMVSFTGGDNPMTEDVVEIGDEGVFFDVKNQLDQYGNKKSLLITAEPLKESQKGLSLENILKKGSLLNYCVEDVPEVMENITTASGIKGIKVRYWIKAGCEGAEVRYLESPEVFFDARPRNEALIHFMADEANSKYFDKMAATFESTPTINYSDN